jgi:parvulin-like peptidyl-prolyl isomerase
MYGQVDGTNRPVGGAFRNAWPILALICLALALAGCSDTRRRDAGRGALSRPIVTVNAEEVSFQEFQAIYQDFLSRWDRFVQNDPAKKQELKELILERIIENILLDQEARRKGLDVNRETLTAKVREAIAPYEESYLEQAVEGSHQSAVDWNRAFRRRLLHEKLINREVLGRIQVSEREVARYYEAHRGEFHVPEQVRVRHLALGSRRAYDRVRRQLEEGADFVALAREHSITPDRLFDGDLGYVERGVMPPEFDDVIFAMERVGSVNNLNKPVQTEMGFHIFRIEDRREARQLSLGEATPRIREILIREKQSSAYQLWLSQLRERATIIVDRQLLSAEMG